MALFGASKEDDVSTLIAKKKYSKAIEVIRAQLKGQRPDPRLRLQLADVLILTGKNREAIAILTPLADEFAREGFAAKAISVLKKIQKIEPGRRDVDARLAGLIEEKQRHATVALPPASGGLEIGMEEIGFEAGSPVAVPADDDMRRPMDLEPAPEPPPSPAPLERPTTVVDNDLFTEGDLAPVEDEPLTLLEPEPVVEAEPFVEAELVLEPEAAVEPEPADAEAVDPMSDSDFAAELLSVIDTAFQDLPADDASFGQDIAPSGGTQIVVSPLFKDFSVDELVAVIQGLNLISFEKGQVILRQGDRGNSLYILTAGMVRAFVKGTDGRQVKVGELEEGAFFGEMSILTGKPRAASIVALSRCELLELDRPTLDSIAASHPHVWDVLREFAKERSQRKS
jgi:CRP-like cAMP-binding protein